jgi:RecJ-like exonuclease
MISEFKQALKEGAVKLKEIGKEQTIRLVSHIDADGISAGAIIIKAMKEGGWKYHFTPVKQLDRKELEILARENYQLYVFTDLGASNLLDIEELFKGKAVFVLDHHKPGKENAKENIIHINPNLFGIDGASEISGAGVTYFFCRELNEKNKKMAYTALIGAIGDVQIKESISELNQEIINDAIESGKIRIERGIRFFGYSTKPIHKIIAYCKEQVIPEISGDEAISIEFLQKIGIYGRDESKFRTLSQLKPEEMNRLAEEIIKKIGNGRKAEDIMWDNYILADEKEDMMRDAREFSTLLNACGRMGKPSLGIGACLGDDEIKKEAIKTVQDYKAEIMNAMDFFNANRNTRNVIEKKGYIIINAKDKIKETIIGTLMSMISKSGMVASGSYIIGMARSDENKTKASLRYAGENMEADLRETIKEIIEKLKSGEFGGHKNAAGAIIPSDKEEEFIKISEEVLERKCMEEGIE